jgi:hypothetical protein
VEAAIKGSLFDGSLQSLLHDARLGHDDVVMLPSAAWR